MELEGKQKWALLIGGLIGAVLGAGAAYLMATAPAQEAEGEEVEPLSATELIALTSAAASLLRRVDDMRRRL
jgi:hypothetical protein